MAYLAKHARRKAPSQRRRFTVSAAGALATLVAAPAMANASVWDEVAECESSGNWSINTGNGYYGGLQFSQSTWVGFGGQRFASYAHYASKNEQIYTAQQVLKVQGPGAWPVCSVRAGLTVSNGLAYDTGIGSGGGGGGSTSGDIAVDGILGPQTYGAMEQWLGRPVDRSFGTSDKKALQTKLGVTADGVIGPITVRALQRKVGATVNGVWGSSTTRALQIYLNKVL